MNRARGLNYIRTKTGNIYALTLSMITKSIYAMGKMRGGENERTNVIYRILGSGRN